MSFEKVSVIVPSHNWSTAVLQSDEKEYVPVKQKQKDAYEMKSEAVGLLMGIGFENIRIYDRILFHRDARVFNSPKCYDFAYMVNGLAKLVEISRRETKVYSIPREVFAELYVVQGMQLCTGITEDILVKVIDNTDFEQGMLGSDNYNEFFQFGYYQTGQKGV